MTICTGNRKCLLSQINVGTGILDCPQNSLTQYGEITDKYIRQMSNFYDNVYVEKYVIMPNHLHLLIRITRNGQSGTPVPTTEREIRANSIIAKFVLHLRDFATKNMVKIYGKPDTTTILSAVKRTISAFGIIYTQMYRDGNMTDFITQTK